MLGQHCYTTEHVTIATYQDPCAKQDNERLPTFKLQPVDNIPLVGSYCLGWLMNWNQTIGLAYLLHDQQFEESFRSLAVKDKAV